MAHLANIAVKEGVEVRKGKHLQSTIARAAEGSVRDLLSPFHGYRACRQQV